MTDDSARSPSCTYHVSKLLGHPSQTRGRGSGYPPSSSKNFLASSIATFDITSPMYDDTAAALGSSISLGLPP